MREEGMELIEEFEESKLDILVVTVTKKKGDGETVFGNERVLLWSGVKGDERAAGAIEYILHKDIKYHLTKWEAVYLIRQELDIKPVSEYIEQRQLGWWGHLKRMNDTA
ncbi:hypothetical protein HHI36_016558 [Cryptolaemus montrouzieri]|uniref:Uncharacterized protein n=1 Tax=Cryptolaemus montrouzieri TaxID=559131 RepID=A0ABD2NKV5_9CUCU